MGTFWAQLSLMHGWIPMILELTAVLTLVLGLGWRTRRWRTVWVPISAACGAALAGVAHWYIGAAGLTGDPAPRALWVWIGATGLAAAAAVAGWAGSRWWRRAVSVLSVPLSLICVAVTVNDWVGYIPTVGAAWSELTAGPLPDQTDRATLAAIQRAARIPANGVVVSVTIDSAASHFKHRDELVYLPPAWFATNPPPALPTAMMIGGEFNTPTDWPRAGDAVETLDAFAAAHGGQAPVVVFVDSGGSFNIDTECVNGARGNAADHLTKDVVPFMVHTFGVSDAPPNWGVVGFSAGGTCALDLAVMHPELFGAFVDIAGDVRPNSGTTTQTIDRLFGGSLAAWQNFDPSTVITRHGHYAGVSGIFVSSGAASDRDQHVVAVDNAEHAAATQLCALGARNGIDCGLIAVPGNHDWPWAGRAFAVALPWLAAQLGTAGMSRAVPLR